MVDLVLRDALKSVYVTWAFNTSVLVIREESYNYFFVFPWDESEQQIYSLHEQQTLDSCAVIKLSLNAYVYVLLADTQRPRTQMEFPSKELAAVCRLCAVSTNHITLRQKQGGEQETFSRGPLPKKKLSLILLLSGRMRLLSRKYIVVRGF